MRWRSGFGPPLATRNYRSMRHLPHIRPVTPALCRGGERSFSASPASTPDSLLDHPEDRVVLVVLGPDAHRVARLEEGGFGLAAADRLDRADLGKARIADTTFAHRLARAAILAAVRDGARTDDRAGAELAGLGGMRDERAEIEGHVDAGIRAAERLAVHIDHQLAVELAVLPPVAERIGGDEHRRKGAGRLGLKEAKALGELAGDQVAQGYVVG